MQTPFAEPTFRGLDPKRAGQQLCLGRIPPFPPIETHTKQIERFVSYFYLWDCFGFVLNFERPKIENPSRLNWLKQKEMSLETFVNREIFRNIFQKV